MTKITSNLNLKKGDVITEIEVTPMWDSKTDTYTMTTFEHKFEITRVNSKTMTCQYIEGAYKGSGFKWIKTNNINTKKEYFTA